MAAFCLQNLALEIFGMLGKVLHQGVQADDGKQKGAVEALATFSSFKLRFYHR